MSAPLSLLDLLVRQIKNAPQNITGYWDSLSKTDPYLRAAVFTADIIFGNGTKIRASTRPVTVYGENGAILPYKPILIENPSVSVSYDFKGGSAAMRSINLSLDARGINPMEIILSGATLAGVGEIALQADGADFNDRYVLIRGEMSGGITFGASREEMEITITDARSSVDKIIPEAITDRVGFTYLPENQIGQRFPLCLTTAQAVPCIMLSSNSYGPTVLAAQGGNVNIARVYVDGVQVPAFEQFVTLEGVITATNWQQVGGMDNRGNPYTGVEFTTTSSPAYEGVTVYAGVTLRSGNAPTILEIIEQLITDHTAIGSDGYDYVLHARAQAKSGGLLYGEIVINGSSENNTATVFSYIDGAICKEFPMFKGCYTGRGYGVIYTDRAAKTTAIRLTRGQELLMDRVSALTETDTRELFNSYSMRYNYNTLTDTYQDVITRDSSNSQICRVSESKIGLREMNPIDSVLIKDYNTAAKVIDWYVNHMSLPSYKVKYIAAPRLFFLVEIGDNVKLTDDRLGLENTTATILGMDLSGGELEIEFQLWLQYDSIA
jgi:hypothetical protein